MMKINRIWKCRKAYVQWQVMLGLIVALMGLLLVLMITGQFGPLLQDAVKRIFRI